LREGLLLSEKERERERERESNEEGERLGVMSPSNGGLFVGSLGVKQSGVEWRAEQN
jgi:hypothetical protein